MRLHEDKELFRDAVTAASRPKEEGGLGIRPIFIEKDYWICHALSLLARSTCADHVVFKGGTSLTKGYGIGARFSEDIDIAVLDADSMSGNQLKNFIHKTAHVMTDGLTEIPKNTTSKGSHYCKAYYQYPQTIHEKVGVINPGELLLEINSFANPFPYQERQITCFLTELMVNHEQTDMVEQFEMAPFSLKLLDHRRTLTEKLVSIIRCSLADDAMSQLTAKIRHFYDLHYLLQNDECRTYLQSADFHNDFSVLLEHDRKNFSKPEGWQHRATTESPLVRDLHTCWGQLQNAYLKGLPEIAYREIPSVSDVEESITQILSCIKV